MKEIKDNKLREIKDDNLPFLTTIFSYGIVLRASLDDIQSLKEILVKKYPDIKIVYQKVSTGKLRITEGDAP